MTKQMKEMAALAFDFNKLAFWRKKTPIIDEQVISEAPSSKNGGSSAQITNANQKNFIVKAVGFQGDGQTDDFVSPEHDLNEIKNACEADSYLNIAVRKYSQLIFKAGYKIVSENDDAEEYLKARFRMMGFATGTPMDITFMEVGHDLVQYANAFLVKSRVEQSQLGGLQAQGVLDTKPVGGYFRIDPTTVTIKRDKNGNIKQYQQELGNESKTFKPTDIVHFYANREGGAAFGTPSVSAALEDVKMLRKIEGNVLDLIYRFAIPLYQMKIGIAKDGFRATDREIDDAKKEVERMASDGIMVTNETTEFHAIGAEGQAIDVTGYLKYFENRIFSALNVSESMMGRGGAKQDADSMEEQAHDNVKHYQRILSCLIEAGIFNELLMEGGYNPIMNPDDIVTFEFNEINLETKVKMETHLMNQFQGGAITFEEMRTALGQQTEGIDESRLFQNMIKQKNALELIQAKLGTNVSNATANEGNSGPDRQDKVSGTADNTISPENQHGKGSAHIKESTANLSESTKNVHGSTRKHVADYKKNFASVHQRYESAKNDICIRKKPTKAILSLARDGIIKDLNNRIYPEASKGIEKAVKDIKTNLIPHQKVILKLVEDSVQESVDKLFKNLEKQLREAKTPEEKQSIFDKNEYRLRFISEHILPKAKWFAYAKTCAQLGIETVYVSFGKVDTVDDGHIEMINTGSFTLDDIPAYHAYCTCKLGTRKSKNKK